MKRSSSVRLLGAILACFGVASIGQGQTDQDATQNAEQYRQIVRLIARKDYDEAIKQGRELLDRTNSYDQVFQRIVEAARADNKLYKAKILFESLVDASPPNPKGYYGLGLVYSELGDNAAAIKFHQRCLQELPEYPPPLLELVSIYSRNRNIAEAKQYLDSLLATRPNSPTAHLGMGRYYLKIGDVESAVKNMDAALSANPKFVEACYYKAFVLSSAERCEESLNTLTKCLPVVEADLNEEQRKLFISVTAIDHFRLGHYSEAFKNFDQLLKIAREMEDKFYEEGTLGYLASIYSMQDDYTRAIATFQQALAVAEESVNQVSIFDSGRYLGNLGRIYFKLGDLLTASHYYERGLEVARKANDLGGQANILSYLGDLMVEQNEVRQAITYYKQALKVEGQRPGITPRSFYYDVLSTLYLRDRDYQNAKETIDQALKSARELKTRLTEPKLLNTLGELYLQLNEPEQAVKAYQESLQSNALINNPSYDWVAHAGLATAYKRLGQLDQARAHYEKAVEVMEGVRANLEGAEEKAGFYQNKIEVYKNLVDVLLKLGEKNLNQVLDSKAFHVAESARARAFSDLLAEARLNLEQNLEADLLKRWREIEAGISKLNAQLINELSKEPAKQDKKKIKELDEELSNADVEHANWLHELRRRNPRYAELKYPEPIELEQLQKTLGERTVLLEYLLDQSQSFLFAVSREQFRIFLLPEAAKIRDRVEKLRAALASPSPGALGNFRLQSAALYRDLIRPAGEMLAGKRELVIVADDVLHRLPFEALLPSEQEPSVSRMPYLVRDYTISYAPSATVLAALNERANLQGVERSGSTKQLLAFADPDYGNSSPEASSPLGVAARSAFGGEGQWKLEPLAGSRKEVEAIAALYPKDAVKLFFGKDANEENAKDEGLLSEYRILHFAAHGLLNEQRPQFSGLVLSLPARSKGESGADDSLGAGARGDGLLQAYEIFNLKLRADLVVLSACETGLGKLVNGEGLMGLTRAFFYAGTPTVVASLWKVADDSTATLMTRFHSHLKDGKGKAEALRQAQLEMIMDGKRPYYWAAFVLIGRA